MNLSQVSITSPTLPGQPQVVAYDVADNSGNRAFQVKRWV